MKKKRAKWIVNSKVVTRKEYEKLYKEGGEDPKDYDIEDFQDIEISVVRENDKHGQESYGWGGDDKIILFNDPGHAVTQEDMDWYQKVAEAVCKALNHEKL